MKKIIAIALALLILPASVFANGSAEQKSDEKIEIRLLTRTSGDNPQAEVFKRALAEFESDHPDVTIVDDSQADESAYNNILFTDIAAGTMADIFRIQGVANLSEYIDNGMIMNLEPYLKDNAWGDGFVKGAVDYYRVPGYEGVYAIPMESGLIPVFYNKDLLKEAGVSEFPKTWDDLLVAVGKLRAIGVTPFALGAQSTYMAGHLHNNIFYKCLGADSAKKLGTREMKWTDPGVVQSLQYVKDLVDAGAFDEGAAGMTDEIAFSQFQNGHAAMIITGMWEISDFSDKNQTPVADSIEVAKFPSFADRPQYKDNDMTVFSPYMVNGKLSGEKLDLVIELLKKLTGPEITKQYAEEAGQWIPRTDVEVDADKCSRLFLDILELSKTTDAAACDVFDFDPITSMQDVTRNAIVSMFIGGTAEDAARAVQSEIDSAQ